MIHELRIYHATPRRLSDLNKRFETITLKLWDKHGIRQAGFWTVLIGPNNHQLYYLIEWKDMAEREQKWGAFMADPEWLEKRAETERNGPLVQRVENMLLAPTSYSKVNFQKYSVILRITFSVIFALPRSPPFLSIT